MVTSMVYACVWLKREHLKNIESLEVIRNRKIGNDLYEKLGETLLENTNILFDKMVKEEINKAGISNNDHEYFKRFKYCVDETNKLIDKGLQFFPASKSPDEVKVNFPDFTKAIKDMLPEVLKLSTPSPDQNAEEN